MLPDFRVRQRDYLLEISRALTQELDLDNLLKRILRLSADMLGGQVGLITLREEGGGWGIAASHGITAEFIRYLDPLLAEVPDHEDPARFELPEINRLLQNLTRAATLDLRSGVWMPLIARNTVLGVIFVFRNYQGSFGTNERKLLQSFADQAAIAVQNAQLYTQATREKGRLDGLLDSAADGMLILTPNRIIERCNPAFARMLDATVEEIQGRPHDQFIRWAEIEHGLTLEQAEAGGWPLSPGASLYVEGDLFRPDDSRLPVGITYAALFSPEGSLVNVIASVRDISHFREAEEIKSTFVSVISHELKTPIALIKGYVGTLRREDASWDRKVVRDSLAVIEEEADRLTKLIEDLLDATRLQAGALSMSLSDLALDTLVERLAERFRTQSAAHEIVVDFPDDFPIVMADEGRIDQVLSNLVSNAIKYATEGGEIRISGEAGDKEVNVCVSDQGPGIAPGDVPHIFDRFYRADEAARQTKGAGLGLYLARAVVEAHGGRIWADPRPGNGARICFSLPRPE